eukprot:7847483-Alexandrium_andersonii.AAC.1
MERAARTAELAGRRLGLTRTLLSDLTLPASPSWAKGGARVGSKERAGAAAAWRRGTVEQGHA